MTLLLVPKLAFVVAMARASKPPKKEVLPPNKVVVLPAKGRTTGLQRAEVQPKSRRRVTGTLYVSSLEWVEDTIRECERVVIDNRRLGRRWNRSSWTTSRG